MKKKNSLSNLLTLAKEVESASSEKSASIPTNLPIDDHNLISPSASKEEKSNSSKDLNVYLSRRNNKSTEPTRLPVDIHKRLKMISVVAGISIEALVANIIEKMLQDNEKEINAYLKKNF